MSDSGSEWRIGAKGVDFLDKLTGHCSQPDDIGARKSQAKRHTRLDWVDALRGLAALSVAVLHFLETQYRDAGMLQSLGEVFNLGKFGVVLFFCISGFVIPRSIRAGSPGPMLQFWTSRFLRLYPAFWVSILAALLFLDGSPTAAKVLANVTMMPRLFGEGDLVGVYWTLQIELIFYFLISVLFAMSSLSERVCTRVAFVCLGIAAAASVIRFYTKVAIPVAIPLALSLMLFSAAFSERGRSDLRSLLSTYGVFVAAMLPISLLAYSFDAGHGESSISYFVSYSLAVTVFLASRIANPVLVFLGKISYSVYLMHATVGLGFLTFAASYLDNGFLFPAYLAVTIGVSSLCYFVVEQPAIAFAKRINARTGRASKAVLRT